MHARRELQQIYGFYNKSHTIVFDLKILPGFACGPAPPHHYHHMREGARFIHGRRILWLRNFVHSASMEPMTGPASPIDPPFSIGLPPKPKAHDANRILRSYGRHNVLCTIMRKIVYIRSYIQKHRINRKIQSQDLYSDNSVIAPFIYFFPPVAYSFQCTHKPKAMHPSLCWPSRMATALFLTIP